MLNAKQHFSMSILVPNLHIELGSGVRYVYIVTI